MDKEGKMIKAHSAATTFRLETGVTATIAAAPEKIMALLTNAPGFTQWNSTIVSLEGQIQPGQTIRLVSTLDPKRVFKLKVSEMTPTRMVWQDGFAPMFKGVRTYTLSPNSGGTTEFSMVEVFSGLMLPMIKGSLPDFKPNFEQYVADLKKAAENN
jgi:hypothetical protein